MRLTETELYLFNNGVNCYAYRTLGCHAVNAGEQAKCYRFSVYAPNAKRVSVVGDFNGWDTASLRMTPCGSTGVWEAFSDTAQVGQRYKFAILTHEDNWLYKADPYAFYSENRPDTASVIYEMDGYEWGDSEYLNRVESPLEKPISIYEVHAGSWKSGLSYRELADELIEYVKDMGYTHIELMPVAEHPLDDSWGYQVTGFYSVTARYGTPHDFMYLVDKCHQSGIGVIVDWVGAHFPKDAHGLRLFDGTPLYEHPDWRRSEQKQWGTLLFDYGRSEVRSFLISNAIFFLKEYHIDGLRADAVSCMLYLDYGREPGEWLENKDGGNINLDAVELFQMLSETVKRECKNALLIAEESTAFPNVTGAPKDGGLGFDLKWNMGYMNDTLSYMSLDPIYRKYHHSKLTFPMMYAFSERFVLPFSHDEVVHGKRSLLQRMPGSYDEMFAQLRLLYAYQFTMPGKKLMFMGDEFGQFIEWDFKKSLDWHLTDYPKHSGVRRAVRALNGIYTKTPALYERETGWDGFEWVSVNDADNSVIAYIRRAADGKGLLTVLNFTPVPRYSYKLPLNGVRRIKRIFTSDAEAFGGINAIKSDEYGAAENAVFIDIGGYEGCIFEINTD